MVLQNAFNGWGVLLLIHAIMFQKSLAMALQIATNSQRMLSTVFPPNTSIFQGKFENGTPYAIHSRNFVHGALTCYSVLRILSIVLFFGLCLLFCFQLVTQTLFSCNFMFLGAMLAQFFQFSYRSYFLLCCLPSAGCAAHPRCIQVRLAHSRLHLPNFKRRR